MRRPHFPSKKRSRWCSFYLLSRFLLLYIFGMLLLDSCTKEVALALKSTTPRLVIEAVVSNAAEGAYVRLSRSQDFTDQNPYTMVTEALVVLSDSNRHLQDTLSVSRDPQGNPYFHSRRIQAIIGHVYGLEVQVDGELYTARSEMADTVAFTGISLLSEAGRLTESSTFTAVPKFTDRAGEKNYYRFEQYVNHKKDPGINVLTDNIGDGLVNERPIFTKDIDIHLGDTLTVVMLQLTKRVYQYFYQLQQNQDDLGATPSNPVSNIQGGGAHPALGYFSAEYRQYFTARIATD